LPCLWGCQKEDIGNPQEVIIGKWELVAEEQEGNRIIPVEADGYIEYLANGELRFSSDGSGEGKWTYQIDSVYLYRYNSSDDLKIPKVIHKYTFINRNTLMLKEARTAEYKMPSPYFSIYQRIK
jgi:hypothetical protein